MSAPYNSKSSKVAERMNRSLVRKAKAMLQETCKKPHVRAESIIDVADVYNYLRSLCLNMKTSHEAMCNVTLISRRYKYLDSQAYLIVTSRTEPISWISNRRRLTILFIEMRCIAYLQKMAPRR